MPPSAPPPRLRGHRFALGLLGAILSSLLLLPLVLPKLRAQGLWPPEGDDAERLALTAHEDDDGGPAKGGGSAVAAALHDLEVMAAGGTPSAANNEALGGHDLPGATPSQLSLSQQNMASLVNVWEARSQQSHNMAAIGIITD